MEKQNKNLFSSLLLAVGTLFIVIAGAIFISKAWGYLPDGIKKFLLMLVTSAFFSVSYLAEIKWNLKKSSIAFYYLGVCFTGYTLFSISNIFISEFILKLVIAQIGMLIPIFIRFLKKHSVLDLILEMLLTDGMSMCLGFYYANNDASYILISFAYSTTIFAALFYYAKKCLSEATEINVISIIVYGLHMIVSTYLSVVYLVFEFSNLQLIVGLTLVFVSFIIINCIYKEYALQIVMIAFVYYYAFAITLSSCRLLSLAPAKIIECISFFVAFFIGSCMMIITRRKELYYAQLILTLYAVFDQLSNIIHTHGSANNLYMPYAFISCIAFIIWEYQKNKKHFSSVAIEFVVTWFVMGLINLYAYFNSDFASESALKLLFAGFFIILSSLTAKDYVLTSGLKTFALLTAVVTLCLHPLFEVNMYLLEYVNIIIAIAIVLVGFIWYDNKKVINIIQFILTCLALFITLCFIFTDYNIVHALFFCIVNVIILLAACFFKKKNYALLSSGSLIITVIYITRAVWMSIAWWIYLFVAGVILVLFAIKREKAEK